MEPACRRSRAAAADAARPRRAARAAGESQPGSGRPWRASRDLDAIRRSMLQPEHHRQILAQVTCQQEMLAHEALALLAHRRDRVWTVEQVAHAKRRTLRRVHQETGVEVEYLQRDAAGLTRDHRLALPERLGHRQ